MPGVECVAVCDLWEGRCTAAQETLKKQVATTRNYKEILDRKDVDAVIVAVTDHQHRRVVVDACAAGKDVYCEKPLSHTVDDGFAMVAAAQKYNRMMQVGQPAGVSRSCMQKAREIYASGKLGDVCCIRGLLGPQFGQRRVGLSDAAGCQRADHRLECLAQTARPSFRSIRSASSAGAALPTTAKDWRRSVRSPDFGDSCSSPEPTRSPQRAQSTGGLFRWKDGREFPDLIETFYDYPNFRVYIRCNLNNEGGEFIGVLRRQGHDDHQGLDPDLCAARHATATGELFDLWLAGPAAE